MRPGTPRDRVLGFTDTLTGVLDYVHPKAKRPRESPASLEGGSRLIWKGLIKD